MPHLEAYVPISGFTLAVPQPFVDHWYVAAIGLAFFGLQIYLCQRFLARMKRHRRELNKLLVDLDDGGDGRDIDAFADDIPWLKWVDRNFPQDATTPGSYTRDDVLKELDSQIAADSNYLLLQRTGVMAPLLGVIITVVGFMVLDMPDDENMSLGDIMFSVMPLVAGVGTGALLAFINQWLLHLAGGRVEGVRYAARSWFDTAIWRNVGLDVQAATVKAITAMERMSRSVARSAERHKEQASTLGEGIRVIRHAAEKFRETLDGFEQEVEHWPDAMRRLTGANEAAAESLQSLLPMGEQAIGQLNDSVDVFRSAVDEHFVNAAKTHSQTTQVLSESVGRINESTMHLKLGSNDLQESVTAHANAFKSLNRSLQKQVLPAHEGFHAAMTRFNGQAEGLLERLENLQDEVVASLEKLTSLAPDASAAVADFAASSGVFAEAVKGRFEPTAEVHQKTVLGLAASVDEMRAAAGELKEANNSVGRLAETHDRLARQAEASQQSLTSAVQQMTETGQTVERSIRKDLMPGNERLRESADTLRESSRQMSLFMKEGLDPATQRLRDLDKTLARMAEAVDAIQQFGMVGDDITRLSTSLSQAANVSTAIGELPEQVRQVLEQVAETHQNQQSLNSRRKWTLFSGSKG